MGKTRREFLRTSAALALGVVGGAGTDAGARPLIPAENAGMNGAQTGVAAAGETPTIRVPTMKFGSVEIGRLVLGGNPFNGYSHFNGTLSGLMVDWYTPDRVCAVPIARISLGLTPTTTA